MCHERTIEFYCNCIIYWKEPCGFYQQHTLEYNMNGLCSNVNPILETRAMFCPGCITGPVEQHLFIAPTEQEIKCERLPQYIYEEKTVLSVDLARKNTGKGRLRASLT